MPDKSHILGPALTEAHFQKSTQIGQDLINFIEKVRREGLTEDRQLIVESWVVQEIAGIRMVVEGLLAKVEAMEKRGGLRP